MADPIDILAHFSTAVRELLADDDIAKANPYEISLTTELMALMIPHFPDWRVNAEWSRREAVEKKIAWNDEQGHEQLKTIRPDIIVHHMHTQENLLVVEAKRLGASQHPANDILKLNMMTLRRSSNEDYHYGYEFGIHLIIDAPNRRIASCDVYVDGQVDGDLTAALRGMLP